MLNLLGYTGPAAEFVFFVNANDKMQKWGCGQNHIGVDSTKNTQPSRNDYETLINISESSVRATHDFIKEEELQFYKPLI